MKKIKAFVNTSNGTKTVMIDAVDVKMTEKQEEKMIRKFNKEVRVLEFVGGCTYTFLIGAARFVKSSSLEELEQMFKAHYNGLPIPERKCFMHK